MSIFFPDFFETNNYFIDEKIGFFKFANAYKVYDEHGEQIGSIRQSVSGWHKVLRLLANIKPMMPFTLAICDMEGKELVSIKRGWTFWMSKIMIEDATGATIGYIRQKFKFMKPTFKILDAQEQEMASITGDWKGWNFKIKDNAENEIGTITKKWNGIMKEAFTTADKYIVSVVPEYAEDTRKIAIVATAITIDMVLKESK
ncbi:MAG: phospholipid scramblase-related protein [Edaphocola sp.]